MNKDHLKNLVKESFVSTLNEIGKEDPEFAKGMKVAAKHRSTGKLIPDEELVVYSKSFQKGYNYLMKGNLYDRLNSKVTDWLGRFGYSRTGGM